VKFADTSYFLALLSPDDEFHAAASEVSASLSEKIVTTMWVLTELGDALHKGRNRQIFLRFIDALAENEDIEIVAATPESFQRGVALFRSRPDKDWSLTDCISITVMTQRGIQEALKSDRHFEQAGFKALLK